MGQAEINSINSSRSRQGKLLRLPRTKLLYWIYFIDVFIVFPRISQSLLFLVGEFSTSRQQNGLRALTLTLENRKKQRPLKTRKLLNQNWILICLNPSVVFQASVQAINLKVVKWFVRHQSIAKSQRECLCGLKSQSALIYNNKQFYS